MIPIRLQLKNFLSYGPHLQTIDFGPYPLICLSGKNGHGKSALLDAITWAVWGHARKVTTAVKADQNLLHLGQTQMMVLFDFEFNNQTYRIKREFAQTYGKPYAALEFGILDPQTQTVHPLTDKTIRATQEKIQEHLGLDYEAFVNSAFLRQGSSNEFSKKSPKERKEILASILSLKQFDTIRKTALDKVRTTHTDITLNQQLQERLKADVAKKEEISAQLESVSLNLKTIIDQETQLQREYETNHKKKKEFLTAQHQYKLLQYQQSQLLTQEKTEQTKLLEQYTTWKELHKKRRALPDKKTVEQEKEQLTLTITEHTALLQTQLEHKEQLLTIKEQEQQFISSTKALYQEKITHYQIDLQRLESENKAIHSAIINYTKQHELGVKEKEETEKELKKLIEQIKNHTVNQKAQTTLENQFEKRKQTYHKWLAQANVCTAELKNIEQKKQLAHDTENPSCPLCEQNLSASRKRFLHTKFSNQEAWLSHRLKRFTKLIQQLKAVLLEQHQQLDVIKKSVQEHQTITTQIEHLHKLIEKQTGGLNELNNRITHLQKDFDQNNATFNLKQQELHKLIQEEKLALEQHSHYQALKIKRELLETHLKESLYKPEQHHKDKLRLTQLEYQLKEYTLITEQTDKAEHIKQQMYERLQKLRMLKKEKQNLEKQLEEFVYLEKLEQEIDNAERVLQENQQHLSKRKEELLQEKGKLENQKAKIDALETELKQHEKSLIALTERIEEFHIIATAMSKDGIQALLIEHAIPEIEQEANLLLSQLTDNQAHIFIESLRDLKKGGTKETLDIVISDPVGIRPYEMFSGGEAFRIDFALRIAISKLLARRAGTSLQTLIIDEGFGSQDEEGLNRIMDALYKIQDNFKKIIVVSHLGWMKDQFPVQFVVNKGPHGSTVTMIEQG